jgi:hypothetical protein
MADRLMDIPAYLVLVGFVELAALLLVSTLALLRAPAWGWRTYRLRVRRWSVFAALFLVIGCAGNSVFMLIAYERMYVSRDTVVDFFPFVPFGQWVLHQEWAGLRGHLTNGASLWEIQLIWAAIAAAVWCVTIWLYRGYVREDEDIQRTIASQPRTV